MFTGQRKGPSGMQRLIWEGRMGQERSEVFVPGGRESTLKWVRAEVPRLRPRMLDAGCWSAERSQSGTAGAAGCAPLNSVTLDGAGLLAHGSHSLQLFLNFFIVVDKMVSPKRQAQVLTPGTCECDLI